MVYNKRKCAKCGKMLMLQSKNSATLCRNCHAPIQKNLNQHIDNLRNMPSNKKLKYIDELLFKKE